MSVEAKPSSENGVTNLQEGSTNYTALVSYYTSASVGFLSRNSKYSLYRRCTLMICVNCRTRH